MKSIKTTIGFSDGKFFMTTEQAMKGKSIRDCKGHNLFAVADDYVAFDLETTGLDPRYDVIIEVGAIRYRGDREVDRFESLVYLDWIDDFIVNLTGITGDMLATAPPLSDVLPRLIAFIGDDIVLGHNTNFDINFLYDNIHELTGGVFTNDFIDTMRFGRRLYPEHGTHTLTAMCDNLRIAERGLHRALNDAEMTARLYQHMKHFIFERGIDVSAWEKGKPFASKISTNKSEFDENHPLFGKLCVFTGALEKMVRRDAMQIVVDLGGLVADNINKKTNYLILGNNDYCTSIKDGKSTKQKKAEQYKLDGRDIEIISEGVFYDMIEGE